MDDADLVLEWGLKGFEGWLRHAERVWGERPIPDDWLQRIDAVAARLQALAEGQRNRRSER